MYRYFADRFDEIRKLLTTDRITVQSRGTRQESLESDMRTKTRVRDLSP
jgi:hypothetical protein